MKGKTFSSLAEQNEYLLSREQNGHVEVAKSYYSVPMEYLGRRIWVRWDEWLVRIFNKSMKQIGMVNYVDHDGRRRVKSTGCRDKTAARQVMTRLEQEIEQVRSGVLSPREFKLAKHRNTSLAEHFDAYEKHLAVKTIRGKKISRAYRKNSEYRLKHVLETCRFRTLGDIDREAVEDWMRQAECDGFSPATINCYRTSILAFCNWAVTYNRLAFNPLADLFRADTTHDIRHQRRALTEEEVARLLKAAELRPIAEYGREIVKLATKTRNGRRKWKRLPLTWETLDDCYARGLEAMKNSPGKIKEYRRIGRQRKLAYRVLLTTGLRKGELAAVTVDCLHLDAERPFLLLPGSFTKNGQTATIPVVCPFGSFWGKNGDMIWQSRRELRDVLSR